MGGSEQWSIWDRSAGQAPWEAFEETAAAWVRQLGFEDAVRTRSTADGGLDVVASGAVAQVKMTATPIQRPDVQRLRGAAFDRTTAIFYSLSGYSAGAVEFADLSGVALFDVMNGMPRPVNDLARVLDQARAERDAAAAAHLQAEREAQDAARQEVDRLRRAEALRAAKAERARARSIRWARLRSGSVSMSRGFLRALQPLGPVVRRWWIPFTAGLVAAGVVVAVAGAVAGWDEPPTWMGGVNLVVWVGVAAGVAVLRERRRGPGSSASP